LLLDAAAARVVRRTLRVVKGLLLQLWLLLGARPPLLVREKPLASEPDCILTY
jgi:hypothetical protein